jgi:DGQHR domain-containing protein
VAASATKKKSGAKKKKSKELSPEQKHKAEKRAFEKSVQSVFDRIGFRPCSALSDIEIEFEGRKGDFDGAFVHENALVFVEYTVSNQSQVGDHIKGKAHLFAKVHADPLGFAAYMCEKFPDLKAAIPPGYHPSQLQVRILYCSKTEIKSEHQDLAPNTSFLWYGSIRYFSDLSRAIKRSARFEFFDFLKIAHSDVGVGGVIGQGAPAVAFAGSVLPEAHSNFPPGFKVISFYVSPGGVLSRAYVLRHDGWRDSDGLYQRMISRKKIESIRKYLRENQRVFVNNVILTLPDDTKLLDVSNQEADPKKLLKTEPITVQLPDRGNTVGIIDGQHRVFSYYEDATADPKIDVYRTRQNLLATGIMYPASYSSKERERFEASLFLEINSTQNAAGSPLKQAIAVITRPFSSDSVGKRVVRRLADLSALKDKLERSFYDQGVLRTATIVSYGLRPLVRLEAEDGLLERWGNAEKRTSVKAGQDLSELDEYTAFASNEVNKFLSAARANLSGERWQLKTKDGPGLLTVTSVNGLLVLFRHYVKLKGLDTFDQYKTDLAKITTFDFGAYKSSRYFAMGTDLYRHLFGSDPTALPE